MTTKSPLSLVAMELAAQLSLRNRTLNIVWRRRDRNQEADALTNEVFDGFSEHLRVDTSGWQDRLLCLPAMAAAFPDFAAAAQEQRARQGQGPATGAALRSQAAKRLAGARKLRDRQPW